MYLSSRRQSQDCQILFDYTTLNERTGRTNKVTQHDLNRRSGLISSSLASHDDV